MAVLGFSQPEDSGRRATRPLPGSTGRLLLHIPETCLNRSISVYICAYAGVCVHLQFISRISAYLARICLYMDWKAPPTFGVAGYWQILTDTYDIHRYEQICVGKNLLKSVKSVKVILTDMYVQNLVNIW